jgi:hypothetical protein
VKMELLNKMQIPGLYMSILKIYEDSERLF